MAWARTAEQLAAQRSISPKRREPNGRQQRATTEEERAAEQRRFAASQPHRKGSDSDLMGSAVGRLYRRQIIDAGQFNAADQFARIATRYMRDVLDCSFRYGSADLNKTGGKSCGREPDEQTIANLRDEWRGIEHALSFAPSPKASYEALIFTCVLDEDPCGDNGRRLLVEGLNALHRLWKKAS